MFTVGVTDVMMEEGIEFDGIIGVSAGATFGCNFKSHQPSRALRYSIRFRNDRRYMGLYSLFTSGDLVNAEFCYRTVPNQYDLFDYDRFEQDRTEFQVVCTDALTGQPVYKRLDSLRGEAMDWLRASASMPIVSRPVHVAGRTLLDGGIADSIPLKHFQQEGYGRCVVVLTQPEGFRKHQTKALPLFRLLMKRYPCITEAMARRHVMYNGQLDYLHSQEEQGNALVIYPHDTLPIGRVQQDKKRMERVYRMGREAAVEALPRLKEFMSKTRKVIGMGETIMDIIFRNGQPRAAVHGGSSFNSIVSVGRAGVPCVFVGDTGADIVGRQTLDFMRANHVGTDYCPMRPDMKSAVSLAYLDDNGDASYVFYKQKPEAPKEWTLPQIDADDVLLYGS